uniref:Uncharacterized protein n=1 Tax=Asparagopsis taxiformis TaxID=260499 RepID=A0A1C9CCA7_9FLOR|nr:hypothetical protein Aspa_144 [Asparagopsis taxiformis]AOM66023.1 hypothetical protein Aspa_144 [Asparagopsis taxiformis]
MDSIIICLEALDIYSTDQINNFLSTDNKKPNYQILSIRNSNYLRHPSCFSICNFTDTIHIIHKIYQITNKPFIQKLINQILEDYISPSKQLSLFTIQYISRFRYIYSKTQDLYNIDHYNNLINIENIAISNIYILNNAQNKYGIYNIIKYLYI